MPDSGIWKREVRVAFSRNAQPLWFRIAKWVLAIVFLIFFWRSPQLWYYIGGLVVLSLAAHLLWRWKTKSWTRPWCGWNDIAAGSPPESPDRPQSPL